MSAPWLRTRPVSHAQRVRKLYKDALDTLRSRYGRDRLLYRFMAVQLRAQFDEYKNENDMMIAKEIVEEGERKLQLWHHPQPFKYAESPGGTAFWREDKPPDWIMDTWHPIEKAMYPEYFARRDLMKQEYLERWERQEAERKES